MADPTPARLTRAAGRRFGLTLGAAFGTLSLIALWRAAFLASLVLGSLSILCALAGLIVPTRLGPFERRWMALGVAISKITTPVVFTLLWWIGFVPTGWLRRRFGRSPFTRRKRATSYWFPREPRDPDVARSAMERQF